jgi:hypothetical protein
VAAVVGDTDKIKVLGSRVKVDNIGRVAEIELAEKMKDKVSVEKDTMEVVR